jgi:osomolarity two-component system phosphorelay intermediate protein YPD1
MPPEDQKKKAEEAENVLKSQPDIIDLSTFSQILEMDEPDDHEFSHSIVYDFFEQAKETFKEMDEAVESSDLTKLSSLGHFLKGSSATLGLIKVRDGCEKIQRYGKQENLDGSSLDDADLCLKWTEKEVENVKTDITKAREQFDAYYKIISDA